MILKFGINRKIAFCNISMTFSPLKIDRDDFLVGLEKKEIPEGDQTEFKWELRSCSLEKTRQTICGFLNGNGGRMVFGVKNNLEIVGLTSDNNQLDQFLTNVDDVTHNGSPVQIIDRNLKGLLPGQIKASFHVFKPQKKF